MVYTFSYATTEIDVNKFFSVCFSVLDNKNDTWPVSVRIIHFSQTKTEQKLKVADTPTSIHV